MAPQSKGFAVAASGYITTGLRASVAMYHVAMCRFVLVGYVASETVPFFAHWNGYGNLLPKLLRFPMATNITESRSPKTIRSGP